MFEDLEEESVDVAPDSPDRAIAYAVYSRGESVGLTPAEAWAILDERYPDDPRFLLLNTYAELNEVRGKSDSPKAEADVLSPNYILKKVERVLGNVASEIQPQVRDLVVFGGAALAGVKGDDAKTLAELRTKLGIEGDADPKRDERDRAGLRLRRFEREVVKELHDRTQDGKALGVRAVAPPSMPPGRDWASAVAGKDKPGRSYAATDRYVRGELVEHPKFGVGIVTGTEPGKAVILFESGVRKLVVGG